MTKSLEIAFGKVMALPDEDQDFIASMIIARITDGDSK